MEEHVPQPESSNRSELQSPESKRPKLDPSALVPVSCSVIVKESVEAELINLDVTTLDLRLLHYSEWFPGNNHRYKFRFKLVYEGSWCLYITWIPKLSILMYVPTISYMLEVKRTNGELIEQKRVTKQRCNQWILTCKGYNKHALSIIDIRNEASTTVQQPNPLLSILSDDENAVDTVDLIGSDSAKVKIFERVLQSHSEVFSRMLAGDWREKKEKSVNMKELNQEALQELKAYMYASKTPIKYASELFVLANEYQMEHLKLCCAEQLYEQLTPENAMQILKLASLYEYKPLVTLVCSCWDELCSLV